MLDLIFLKLGGSLITDKNQASTPRRDVLTRLAQEITSVYTLKNSFQLVIGHGSGSFGHTAGSKYGTRQGVRSPDDWSGFVEVWKEARTLNQIVLEAFSGAGLPMIAFPPSACVITCDGQLFQWDIRPLVSALNAGLVPLVNGDTAFDITRGGTIISTEDVFYFLARQLHPERILLAGIDEGVFEDFPSCQQLIEIITPQNFDLIATKIGRSASPDVTGGMLEKVTNMLALVQELPEIQSMIFSGKHPGNVAGALRGATIGTCIRAT